MPMIRKTPMPAREVEASLRRAGATPAALEGYVRLIAGPASGLPQAPELYIVFTGERPQFITYNEEGASRWVRKGSEFTHFVKYVAASGQAAAVPAPGHISSCWRCGQRVTAAHPGYWQQSQMRPVHIDCHEAAERAEKLGKTARKRARKRRP